MTAARKVANLVSGTGTDILSTGTTNTPLTIQAFSGQTADLVQVKNSSGSVMAKIDAAGEFVHPGTILQFANIRVDAQATYTGTGSGNGTEISLLNQTITPRRADSKLMIYWEIWGEVHWDGTIVVWKNGSIMTNGYNTVSGNNRWSGYSGFNYDPDFSTTPTRMPITFIDTPGTTASTTYSLAYRSANADNRIFYLNRSASSSGSDNNEVGVSMGYIMEIAQ
jgi:hypothetical protein